MDARDALVAHLSFFADLGVPGVSRDPRWTSRDEAGPAPAGAPAPVSGRDGAAPEVIDLKTGTSGSLFAEEPEAGETPEAIRAALGDCTRCKLHQAGRLQIVFGAGNPHAELMFVGEAPGHDEDIQGIPFVGRAGQLLTRIIESIDLTRDQVYIANVIKCRPPGNRNPEPDEVASCEPFLLRQVQAIRPKVIVALGAIAARSLLKTQDPISRLRGRFFRYGPALVLPTFHPAFLLRSPDRKRDVWEDMKKVRAVLAGNAEEQGELAGTSAVAVPVPFLGLLTYSVPEGIDVPPAGVRVLVPFGARQVTGVVVAAGDRPDQATPLPLPPDGIKDLVDVLDDSPFVPAEVIRLALWAADYYACSPGEAVAAAMPPLAWVASECLVQVTEHGSAWIDDSRRRPLGAGRETLLTALADGRWTAVRTLARRRCGRGAPSPAERPCAGDRAPARTRWPRAARKRRFADARRRSRPSALSSSRQREGAGGPGPGWGRGRRGQGPPRGQAARGVTHCSRGVLCRCPSERWPVAACPPIRLRDCAAVKPCHVRRQPIDRDPLIASRSQEHRSRPCAGTAVLTAEQAAALDRLTLACDRRQVSRRAVARRHRQRQDRDLSAPCRRSCADRGRGVLVLVPEIALTPALATVFRAVFGDRVAIQHSGLSDGERHDQWQRIRGGDHRHRRRHAVGGLRAAAVARPHHRRRGARHLVQAGGEPSVPRP